MATVRQRFNLAPDYGGELGLGPVLPPAPSGPPPWRRRFENFLWIAAATFAIYYGDSQKHLFHVLFYDPRIRRSDFPTI